MNDNTIKNFFKLISCVVGLTPGFLIILANITIIPIFSSKEMGGVVEAACGFIVGFALVNKNLLKKISPKSLNVIATVCIIVFVACVFVHDIILKHHYIPPGQHLQGIVKPFWLSNNAINYISTHNSADLDDFFDQKGPGATDDMLNDHSWFSYNITIFAIFFVFTLIFACLTSAFISMWIRYEKNLDAEAINKSMVPAKTRVNKTKTQ